MSGREKHPPWERMYSKEANRRWSMALSSMGHSQTSAQSLQSIAGDKDAGICNPTNFHPFIYKNFFACLDFLIFEYMIVD